MSSSRTTVSLRRCRCGRPTDWLGCRLHLLEDRIEDFCEPPPESRSANSSIEPLRSAKSRVTCFCSPSRALFEVRILSARCLECTAQGEAKRGLAGVWGTDLTLTSPGRRRSGRWDDLSSRAPRVVNKAHPLLGRPVRLALLAPCVALRDAVPQGGPVGRRCLG